MRHTTHHPSLRLNRPRAHALTGAAECPPVLDLSDLTRPVRSRLLVFIVHYGDPL